ncbi:MAG: peptidylprolyl isomerase [Bacteroidota bacterium]
MAIEANKVVTLSYKLSDNKTGVQIEETSADNPMVFLFGSGGLIPEFEINIQGKKVGDTFAFSIDAENAYGNHQPQEIGKIPVDSFFNEEGKLEEEYVYVGALVPMTDQDGNQLQGVVVDITDEYVEMDFNHPLAGIDLKFEGKILNVRPATQEELSHGHAHGADGHHDH